MAGFSAVFEGISLKLVFDDAALSEPVHNLLTAKGARTGVPRVLGVDRNEPRTLSGRLKVIAASKDAAIAQVAELNAKLRTGGSLVLQSSDATSSVTLTVLPSPALAPRLNDPLWEWDDYGLVPFRFICEPYAYGPETTLVDAASVTYPNVVDLTIPGDFPTPLQIEVNAAGGMHCLHMGLLPDQATPLTTLLHQCHDLAWTGGGTATEVASGDTYSGYYVHNSSANQEAAYPMDTTVPAGTYQILFRVGVYAAGTAYYWTASSGAWLPNTVGWNLQDFGTYRLPTSAVRGTVDSVFTIMQKAGDVGAACDYVGFVPQSWGWWSFHPTWGGYSVLQVALEYDGRAYEGDIASSISRSSGMSAVGDVRLCGFADKVHGASNGSVATTTTVKVVPRYALWSTDGAAPGPSM